MYNIDCLILIRFNLDYGKNYFEGNELLKQLRSIIDEKARQRMMSES
ncbi:hypothetical protein QBE55_00220 [Eubacteriales bacterium mix99]|jgi:hypothetical protein